jgi:hypothetical protein
MRRMPPVAVRGPHHCDVASDAVEPDDAVDRRSFDGRLTLELQTKLGKERDRRLEVVDEEEDVIHPQKCHIPSVGVGCLARFVGPAATEIRPPPRGRDHALSDRRRAIARRLRWCRRSAVHSAQWRWIGERRSSTWWHRSHSTSAVFSHSRGRPGRGSDISTVSSPLERSKWPAPARVQHPAAGQGTGRRLSPVVAARTCRPNRSLAVPPRPRLATPTSAPDVSPRFWLARGHRR